MKERKFIESVYVFNTIEAFDPLRGKHLLRAVSPSGRFTDYFTRSGVRPNHIGLFRYLSPTFTQDLQIVCISKLLTFVSDLSYIGEGG